MSSSPEDQWRIDNTRHLRGLRLEFQRYDHVAVSTGQVGREQRSAVRLGPPVPANVGTRDTHRTAPLIEPPVAAYDNMVWRLAEKECARETGVN